jgi:DNA-directed RNA polymerase subunit RPC12/RpoP
MTQTIIAPPPKYNEHFRCLSCGVEFLYKPGPVSRCPRCQGKYFLWVNWEKDWYCDAQTGSWCRLSLEHEKPKQEQTEDQKL